MGKTLVTGASGFTGKGVCRRLVQQGEQVVAFTRPTSNIGELQAIGVECRKIDIKSRSVVKDNFSDISKVYHIAAAYRTEHSDQEEFRQVNVEATRNLLEAAKLSNVKRFIHCSTVGVQGEIDDPPASEEYRYKPGDHYQASKLEGEILAREYFSNGLPGVVVRPVGIYGPGDTRFLKLFRPINKGFFVMIGSGNVLYHMTYITDLVEGILLCGTKEEALGEVFTIGGGIYDYSGPGESDRRCVKQTTAQMAHPVSPGLCGFGCLRQGLQVPGASSPAVPSPGGVLSPGQGVQHR